MLYPSLHVGIEYRILLVKHCSMYPLNPNMVLWVVIHEHQHMAAKAGFHLMPSSTNQLPLIVLQNVPENHSYHPPFLLRIFYSL